MLSQQDASMPGTKKQCPFFIYMHEVGIAHDVCENDSCELAFEFTFHCGVKDNRREGESLKL
jgi:hypothetical protein